MKDNKTQTATPVLLIKYLLVSGHSQRPGGAGGAHRREHAAAGHDGDLRHPDTGGLPLGSRLCCVTIFYQSHFSIL